MKLFWMPMSFLMAVSLLQAPLHARAEDGDGDVLVVAQGGERVTLADVDAFMERIPAAERAAFLSRPERVERLLLRLLSDKQLAAQAVGSEIDPRSDKDAPLSLSDTEALARAEVARFRKDLVIPDMNPLAQEHYLAHREKYQSPEVLELRAIFISTGSRSADEAQARAAHVVQQARSNPSRFGDLVSEFSDDPRKAKDLGFMTNARGGRISEPIADAARGLDEGSISAPIAANGGFYVLQIVRKEPARQRTLEEAAPDILSELEKKYVEDKVAEMLSAISARPLDPNPDAIASLRNRYGPVSRADAAVEAGAQD